MTPRLVLVAMIALAAACTDPGPLPTPMESSFPTATTDVPPWIVATDAELGISIRVPSSWTVDWHPCPDCANPRGLFHAASFAIHEPDLFCSPLPSGQAVVSLSETLTAFGIRPRRAEYPPRPVRFEVTRLHSSQVTKGCNQPLAELFRFRDVGRFLYAWVVFGESPLADHRSDVETLLNSIQVSPLSEPDS